MLPVPSLTDLASKFPAINQELRQRGLDVGACSPGGCGPHSCNTGCEEIMDPRNGPMSPAEQARACGLYSTCITFGFQLSVDSKGNLFTRGTLTPAGGAPVAAYTAVGTELNIDFDQPGYLCIYGINAQLLSGTAVVIDSLQPKSEPDRFNNTSVSIYETTGCWCPFEACIITGQSPLVLKAKSVPKTGDTTSTPVDASDSTGATNLPAEFYADFSLNFLAVSIRSITGSCFVAPTIHPGAAM